MTFHRHAIWISGALLMAASASAQERAYDKIVVDLPANTWVGGEKLAAGKYEMRQLPSPGDASNVILVNEKSNRRYTASAISERALKNIPVQQTQVTLQRVGTEYYLDHIWIAGREFGYKFVVPPEVTQRIKELEQPLTLSATYSTPAPVVAQAAPPPPAPAPPPQAAPAPAPQPPAEQPAPQAAPAPEAAPPPTPQLPRTASDWPLVLTGGLACLALGLTMRVLRRLRS
jgi:cell division protein FtsN